MDQIKNQPQIHARKNIQRDKYARVPKDYLKVAEGMEAQFTNHLLREMRKTVQPTNPDTQAQKIYKSLLDDERSKMMASSRSGLGVKDMVLDQIYPHWRAKPNQQGLNTYNQVQINQKGVKNE